MVDEIDDVAFAKLRFLANAAVSALSEPDPNGGAATEASPDFISPDADPRMLRQVLRHAVPVLLAAGHRELVLHIDKALNEVAGEAK